MVKNTTGGSRAKSQASKNAYRPTNVHLRTSTNEFELYAKVTAMLGNGMCHVLCIDGVTRLCHIRGCFRGRKKSDNIVKKEAVVLVGAREWETQNSKKIQNVDLLEVYTDAEKDKLTSTVSANWIVFATSDNVSEYAKDSLVFTDSKQEDYQQILEKKIINSQNKTVVVDVGGDDDEIDIDDI